MFSVQTPIFEGPLELLLSLIEKRKLFINDIALAAVAEDYLQYVRRLERFPVSDASKFLVIASTLTLIKSRSLLPNFKLTEEENSDVKELEERLKEYRRVRELARYVKVRFGKSIMFTPMRRSEILPVFSPGFSTTLPALALAMRNVLSRLQKKEIIMKAEVKKALSIKDAMESLVRRVGAGARESFSGLLGLDRREKSRLILNFLALLELVRQGALAVSQEGHFGDIIIGGSDPT